MPEEEAFCVFVRLMQEYRLRELFKPTMAELGLCIYQFEYMLQVKTVSDNASRSCQILNLKSLLWIPCSRLAYRCLRYRRLFGKAVKDVYSCDICSHVLKNLSPCLGNSPNLSCDVGGLLDILKMKGCVLCLFRSSCLNWISTSALKAFLLLCTHHHGFLLSSSQPFLCLWPLEYLTSSCMR